MSESVCHYGNINYNQNLADGLPAWTPLMLMVGRGNFKNFFEQVEEEIKEMELEIKKDENGKIEIELPQEFLKDKTGELTLQLEDGTEITIVHTQHKCGAM